LQALYHPALTKRNAMQFEDHPAPRTPTPGGPSRGAAWLAAAALALLVVVVVVTVVVNRSNKMTGSPAPEPSSPRATVAPTTTIKTQTEVVARLREILTIRDRALLSREVSLLDGIYTVDCNCLKGWEDYYPAASPREGGLEGAIDEAYSPTGSARKRPFMDRNWSAEHASSSYRE
jgi:hypothetical protein